MRICSVIILVRLTDISKRPSDLKQNGTQKKHHFLAQFSIPFYKVWSVLLRVLAQKTTFWQVEILWQPIRSFYLMVFEATTHNKIGHTMWKGMKNCARKWCLFLCTILFVITWAFCKMCMGLWVFSDSFVLLFVKSK